MKRLIVAITAIAVLVVPATTVAAKRVKPKPGTYEGEVLQQVVPGFPPFPGNIEFTLKKKQAAGRFFMVVDCWDPADPVFPAAIGDFVFGPDKLIPGRTGPRLFADDKLIDASFDTEYTIDVFAKWKRKKKAKGVVSSQIKVAPLVTVFQDLGAENPTLRPQPGDCIYHAGSQPEEGSRLGPYPEGPYTLASGKLRFVARWVSS